MPIESIFFYSLAGSYVTGNFISIADLIARSCYFGSLYFYSLKFCLFSGLRF